MRLAEEVRFSILMFLILNDWALTTFSPYGLESFMLLHEGRCAAGAINIAVHNLLGIGLVVLGFACPELLFEGSLSGVLIGTET